MTTPTLNYEQLYGQFSDSDLDIAPKPDEIDYTAIEENAARSAEALMRFEALYGEDAAQLIVDWCNDNNEVPAKAIANIVTPLAYMALGATVEFGNETLDGPEVLGRHFGLPPETFRIA